MNDAGVAPAGGDAHPAADDARAQRRHPVARQFLPGTQHDSRIDLRLAATEAEPFFHGQQDFADAEQTDDRNQEVKAVQQLRVTKGQAQLAGDRVETNRRQRKTNHHRRNGLEWRLLAEADEAAESARK